MLKNSFMNDVLYIDSHFSTPTFSSVRLSTTTLVFRLCISHYLPNPTSFIYSYLVTFTNELNINHVILNTVFKRALYSNLSFYNTLLYPLSVFEIDTPRWLTVFRSCHVWSHVFIIILSFVIPGRRPFGSKIWETNFYSLYVVHLYCLHLVCFYLLNVATF